MASNQSHTLNTLYSTKDLATICAKTFGIGWGLLTNILHIYIGCVGGFRWRSGEGGVEGGGI